MRLPRHNPEVRERNSLRPELTTALVMGFLAVSFLHVWLRVQPRLEYYHCGPYFFRQRAFFAPFLARPGGLAGYAGVFLAQFNCADGLGALAFVLVQGLVFFATGACLRRLTGRASALAALAPLLILLLLRNHYGCPWPALALGLLLALGAAAMQLAWPWRRPGGFAALSGLLAALLFWLAGLWVALLLGSLCGWFAWRRWRQWGTGLGCVLLALVGPLWWTGVAPRPGGGLDPAWLEGANPLLAATLYAVVPLAAAVLAWLPQPADALIAPPSAQLKAVLLGLACLGAGSAVGFTFDRRQQLLAEMDYETGAGRYASVLAAARQVKALDDPARTRVEYALYHTGRLAEEFFSFHSLVEPTPGGSLGESCRAQSQPLFELGLINDAEHMACEALELEGERPDSLRLLARIQRRQDRPQAAQVCLNVLSLIPVQEERAEAAWPRVEPRGAASETSAVDGGPALVLTNEVLHDGLPVGRLLTVVLAAQPTNRMAFEYAMADYLLTLDLKPAIELLPLLDHFAYPHIPRPYEEAALLYQQAARAPLDLKGRRLRPETIERFRRFQAAAKQYRASAEDLAAMAAQFGDTYWYYYYTMLGRERAANRQPAPP